MTIDRRRHDPPLPTRHFLQHMVRQAGWGGIVVGGSAAFGTLGYHALAGFSWVDSFLNACMLLGGMGPVGDLPNDASKLFASIFALYSGLVFLILAGLMLAPVFHRVLHKFHMEDR